MKDVYHVTEVAQIPIVIVSNALMIHIILILLKQIIALEKKNYQVLAII